MQLAFGIFRSTGREEKGGRGNFINKMTTRAPLILVLVGVVFAFTAFVNHSPVDIAANTVVLPIRIQPILDTNYRVPVTLNVSNASGINRLWLWMHAPDHRDGKDGKVSVRINSGPWIDLTNLNVTCGYPENKYECIGGAYATIRFTVPVTGVINGVNTVEFKYNNDPYQDRSSARVIGINFLRSSYTGPLHQNDVQRNGAVDGTVFVEDDPSKWTLPLVNGRAATQTDIDAGRGIFTGTTKQIGPGFGCSGCHTSDGSDLRYYNYHNETLIVQAKKSGISQTEAEQVAAYIRSIDLKFPSGWNEKNCGGRPWNPPYQPGPGLDAKPVECWAAGAGIEWVLENDMDALPYVFPNGTSQSALMKIMHPDSTVNNREWPIAMQLPDWNNWLSDKQVFTIFGESTFKSSTMWRAYQTLLTNLSNPSIRQQWIDEEKKLHPDLGRLRDELRKLGLLFHELSFPVADDWTAKQSFKQWQAVREWEIMNRFKLQELGDYIYKNNLKGLYSGGTNRTWISQHSALFDTAPHKIVPKPPYPDVGPYPNSKNPSVKQQDYFSAAWYQLALITNAGNRAGVDLFPFDWNYHLPLLADASRGYGHCHGLQLVQEAVNSIQMRNNWVGIHKDLTRVYGWNMHNTTPTKMVNSTGYSNLPECIAPDVRPAFTEAVLRAWMIKTLRHAPSEWLRKNGVTGPHVETADYTPTMGDGYMTQFLPYADNFYRAMPRYKQLGVSPALIDSVARWGESMWPKGNWEQFMGLYNTAPSVSLTSPGDGSVFYAPANVTLQANASDPEGKLARVEFYANNTKLNEDTSAPYSYAWTGAPAGIYSLKAVAVDVEGVSATSSAVQIAVETGSTSTDPGTVSPGLDYSYYEGSFSRVPDFGSLIPIKSGSVSNFDISVANQLEYFAIRFSGFIEVPAGGTYTFYTASDDGSVLWINGIKVVDNDGNHGIQERSGSIPLSAGRHAITVGFFQGHQGKSLTVSWSGPGMTKQYIPETSLYRSAAAPGLQEIQLNAGWNIFSLYVRPTNSNLDELLASVLPSVVLMKNDVGQVYSPGMGVNTIGTWNEGDAYQIFVSEASVLNVQGEDLSPENTPVSLGQGWNLLPYLRRSSLSIADALASITDQVVLIMDNAGRIYYPQYGTDEIGNLQPGQGYRAFLSASATLTYPSNDETGSYSKKDETLLPPGPGVAVSAVLVLHAPDLIDGTKISVWTPDGEQASQAQIRGGYAVLTVRGDDPNTTRVEGMGIGEPMAITSGSSSADTTHLNLESITNALSKSPVIGPLQFSQDAILLIKASSIPHEFNLEQNYPNPFNPETTIRYALPVDTQVTLEVFDVTGRRVGMIVNEWQTKGKHEVSFRADHLSSGIYIYRLKAGDQTQIRKMMLLE